MAHVTAGLALPKASSNDSDVATKSHVLLKCPREGGLYFLDSVVEHAASLARADVVRIDPQDLEEIAGDCLGDTKCLSLSNLTSQKIRTLGYDAQSQSHSLVPTREEDPEEDEEEDSEYIDSPPKQPQPQLYITPVFTPVRGQGAFPPLRSAMVALIPGGANSGNTLLPTASTASSRVIYADQKNETKLYNLLEAIIDSAATKRAQSNVPAVYQDSWCADPMAPHDIAHIPSQTSSSASIATTLSSSTDSAPPLPPPTPPPQKTIVHIRDYSELLRTPQGAPIIRMIHAIVSQRRLSGQPTLILGTTSTPETSYSLTRENLEAAQELTPEANERTIIVPPAKSPAEDDLNEIMESDRRARIREVNIRHLRDIIRRRSGEGRGGIELAVPRDWHLREDEDGGAEGIEGIEEEMWSFDRAHRVATMAIGMYHKWWQSVRMPQVPVPVPVTTTQPPITPQQQKEVGDLVAAALGPEGTPLAPTPSLTTPTPRPPPLEYTPGILTPAHIAAAAISLTQSDNFKYTWATTERRRLRSHETPSTTDALTAPAPLSDDLLDDLDPHDPTLPPKPKSASSQLMKKLSKICNPHEQKLLSGVINPDKIRVGFSQVRVPKETVEALKTLTSLSLVRPEAFRYGVLATDRIPGVLLYGPPGTGKTLLARAVAKESGATVLEVSGSDIFDMYVGEGEKNVRAIFTLASRLSPCIIFLDEADAILASRSSASSPRTTHREIINQFLREWADVPLSLSPTFLMVATNRPFDLDDAVLRRLPRRILVDLPTQTDRLEIFRIHLREESLAADVDLMDLSKRTSLYSGSDLKNLCVAAALACVKEAQEEWVSKGVRFPEKRILEKRHFEKALKEVGASVGEDMGTLGAMRKWDEKFGEGRRRKGGRMMGFGGLSGKEKEGGKYGGGDGPVEEGAGRVRRG
ncbi:AAA-domain-containing protein [Terfezia boudieri ATCC MYA-4762]|uniref:AAA-domain-containing protein n=1 Tax=Terfezia boudieri ATCC MYA-4762 TaxID=1051890 RepID=A0A3N4M3X2_9PEZI|nr:AAA-domain-containing protein [Terfezia boudieri ATCC MYA-4762]